MTVFYLIRHAEAEGNLYRRMHGQYDTMITPNGMRQIHALAERFADIPVDVCYTSDQLRARTTAQAICVPRKLDMLPDPAFRELYVGRWENTDFGYLHTFEGQDMAAFTQDPVHWQVPGSESFEAYTARFIERLETLGRRHDGQTVAVFSHAAVMRGVMIRLFPDQPVLPTDNTSVTKLEYADGQFSLVYLNDNSHLPLEISTSHGRQTMKPAPGQSNFWYREDGPLTYAVMAGETAVGRLELEEAGDSGVIRHMELLEPWRHSGRSVQLLGKAVFTFRDMGKTALVFQKPQGLLDDLCRRMELHPDDTGLARMDITLRMRPFF